MPPLSKLFAERCELLHCLERICVATSVAEADASLMRLCDFDIRVLEDYLLQISHLCFSHDDSGVQEKLASTMMWMASNSLQVALRLAWTVDAASSSYCSTEVLTQRLKRIQDGVESCAINRVQWASSMTIVGSDGTPPRSESRGGRRLSSASDEMEISAVDVAAVQRKEARLKLYNDQRQFVATLTELSEMLRYVPDRTRRKGELHTRLRELNRRLEGMRLMHPIGQSTDPVRWIVRLAVEECIVFSSRERAPFIVRYEVIVDDTATMQDPTLSRLRGADGRFRVSSTADEWFEPTTSTTASPLNRSNGSTSAPTKPPPPPVEVDFIRRAFGESREERHARIRRNSPWGSHPNWSMSAMIVKAGDDLRQEELALQLIQWFAQLWNETGLTVTVQPYVALPTSVDCGVLEVVEEANSIDGIKKACGVPSLYQFFTTAYDGEGSSQYRAAQRQFVESIAGYSVISFLLQIKDRHNGNLMVSRHGRLTHIDFGFLLTTSPGGINFESAPFKLSQELLDVLGAPCSHAYSYYKVLVYQALEAARQSSEDLLSLLGIMATHNTMPCFGTDAAGAVGQLRGRLRCDLRAGAEAALFAKDLITSSADNWRTRRYDQFQTLQNGIL